MTEKGITCQTCPEPEQDENENNVEDQFGLTNFDELDIRGIFDINIKSGDEYAVELIGSDDEKSKYKIFRSGETLVIEYESGTKKFDWDRDVANMDEIRINITMPHLEKIDAEGYGSIRFEEFTMNDMEIDMRGPVNIRGTLNADNLIVNLTGKSEAELSGQVNNLDAELQFASKLRAYNLETRDATVEANGASSAKVNVSHSLEMDEGLASDIDYRGNPEVINRE
jgi:hypothetical protein